MIVEGLKRIQSRQSQWVRAFAVPLPFDENRFDLVVCLEVLEFTPNPGETLQELKRVLKPGGWLLVTNRIGWEAAWILGKTSPKEVFIRNLVDLGFHGIEILPWQKDYDLAWARKTFAI
jgi:ubiquinone/menaquinone biosynthesis C-methylase UbiE